MASQFPTERKPLVIMMVASEHADVEHVQRAFAKNMSRVDLRWIKRGHQLVDRLCRTHYGRNHRDCPKPDLILLSMSVPDWDDVETLKALKANQEFCSIPTALMTRINGEQNTSSGCGLGPGVPALKPIPFEEMMGSLRSLPHYWFGIVEPPEEEFIGFSGADFSIPLISSVWHRTGRRSYYVGK